MGSSELVSPQKGRYTSKVPLLLVAWIVKEITALRG
jgi:hypothetical protein